MSKKRCDFHPEINRTLPALLCACILLGVVPLMYHDAFFDINRFKVKAVITSAVIGSLFAILIEGIERIRGRSKAVRQFDASAAVPAAFLLCCGLSCAVNGWEPEMLSGSQGRYCGLFFLTACTAMYAIIVRGRLSPTIPVVVLIAAAAGCSGLGIANACGMDPLNFYPQIKASQRSSFISTIGNIDFFAIYLTMVLPIAAIYAVKGKRRAERAAAKAAVWVLISGIGAARTDIAMMAMHLCFLMLTAVCADSFGQMKAVLKMWEAGVLLPVIVRRAIEQTTKYSFAGICGVLTQYREAAAMAFVLLAMYAALWLMERKGVHVPGASVCTKGMLAAAAVTAVILLALAIYLTECVGEAGCPALLKGLVIDDAWGSRRGFVYRRSIRAFAEYNGPEKLFGKGLDTTLRILTPYFDDPAMLRYGMFNDAHNQILQFLLTGGLLTAGTYLALLAYNAKAFLHNADKSPVIKGMSVMAVVFPFCMLFTVTQPILMVVYYAMTALGHSIIKRRNEAEEGAEG